MSIDCTVVIENHSTNLTALYLQSQKLFEDAVRYGDVLKAQSIQSRTATDYLKILERTMLLAIKMLPEGDMKRLQQQGLLALTEDNARILSTLCSDERICGWRKRALRRAVLAIFPNAVIQPNIIVIGDGSANLRELRQCSEKIFDEIVRYADFLRGELGSNVPRKAASYLKYIENIILKAVEVLPGEDVEQLRERGLVVLTDNGGRLLSTLYLNKEMPEYHRTALRRAVVALFPEAFIKRKEVIFGRRTADLTYLYQISENLFDDAIRYADILRAESHKPATCVGYINSLQYFIHKSFEILPLTDVEKLRLRGLVALTDDNGRILLMACSDKRIHVRDKGVIRRTVAALFPDAFIKSYVVAIGNHKVNLTALHHHSETLFDDCVRYGDILRGQPDKVAPQTSVVYLKTVQRILLQAFDILLSADVEQLQMRGLVVLTEEDGRILTMLSSDTRVLWHHIATLQRAVMALFPDAVSNRYSVVIGNCRANLSALCQHSEKLFHDAVRYGDLLQARQSNARTSLMYVKYIEHIMLKAAEILPSRDVKQLQQHGLLALTKDNGRILSILHSNREIPDYYRAALRRAVAVLFPDAVTKKSVVVDNCSVDLTRLYQLSEMLFNDAAKYGRILQAQNRISSKVAAGYLKYIQHIMLKASEILPSADAEHLLGRGLVALTDDNGRILSYLCSNKDIYVHHRGALRQAVATLYPGAFPNKKTVVMEGGSSVDLTVLFQHSEQLFDDATRYRDILEARTDRILPGALYRYLKNIEKVMVKAFKILPATDVENLRHHGLVTLSDGRILSVLYNDERITQYEKGALRTAVTALFPDAVVNPTLISIGHRSTNLTLLHQQSEKLFEDVKTYANIMETQSNHVIKASSLGYLKDLEHVMLKAFEILPTTDVKALREEGLIAFTHDNGRLLSMLRSDERIPRRKAWLLPVAVNALFPSVLNQPKLVFIGDKCTDLSILYQRSEALFSDAERYGKLLEADSSILPATATQYLKNIERFVFKAEEVLPRSDIDLLLQRGLIALCDGNGHLLSTLYSNKKIHVNHRTCLRLAVAALYPDLVRSRGELLLYRLSFRNEFSKEPDYCDYSPVRELSIKLYEDHVAYLEGLKASQADNSADTITLMNRFRQFRSIILLTKEHLGQDDIIRLREHGMSAFEQDRSRLQKVFFAFLQNAVKTQILNTTSAYSYKSTLVWFLKGFGINVIDVYPITTSKTVIHLKRLNAKDYYSSEECRELAYHIESLLNKSDLPAEHRIALMLGRILLKTGWNLATTLGIQCDDIIHKFSVLNPEGVLTVVLCKARAGYRSDAYTFLNSSANRAAIRSAAVDILQIRDEWTAELRASLPDSDPFKPFVFLYENAGGILRLSPKVTAVLTGLLREQGCKLTFDSKKIRKGGYNHLYRELKKNIQEYEQAAKHQFKTFESNYLRVDENQSRYTLAKAVDVMGKYFTGKEISPDIIIVTDQDRSFQHTPTGECASKGNDDEALRYGAEHKRILDERQQTVRYCADFLSCIWCKFYRLVADPEHVWRLLSYRDYVLRSMEASVVEGDSVEDQQTYIEILKDRINEMLRMVDRKAPGVVEKGNGLMRERGMHPDWSFALADAHGG